MKQMLRYLMVVLVVGFAGACTQGHRPGKITPPVAEMITVTGQVTEIHNRVPVDGGVTMTLKIDDGSAETLYFGSLFTSPPPSQARLDLYEVIRQVQIGDRVKASGMIDETGIILEGLVILSP